MQETLDPRSLAAFIGICPIKHESGSSVYSAPTSRHFGPKVTQTPLSGGCSVRTHKKQFQQYFYRKVADGKHKNWSSTTSKTRSSRLLVLSSARNNPTFPTMLLSIPWFFKKP
ncbi:MAG: transposase [Anaerolineae bacterium]|nr:transposase [Anaerolineae bacterium]